MAKFIIFIFIIIAYNSSLIAMEKKPYHHLPDGTFRNPEGSPVRTSQAKFSYTQFIKLKKKIDMTVPKEHVVDKEKVLSDLEKYKNEDYIAWIGHATYLIKLGDTTIITDPVFSKNAGPLIFGPDRFTKPALNLESSVPCTPLGCYLMIKKIEPNLSGKKAVMIGRSNLNGKPMAQLLLKENCTVTITHSKTKDLKAECLEADIIVAAVGIPELVKADWVKKDAIVIDVGINKTENGIVGDVAFEEVSKVARALTLFQVE